MSSLQFNLYKHLLNSRLVKSCFRHSVPFSPHLICIGALKKLCNSPSLIYEAALTSASSSASHLDGDEQQVRSVYVYTWHVIYNSHGMQMWYSTLSTVAIMTTLSKLVQLSN